MSSFDPVNITFITLLVGCLRYKIMSFFVVVYLSTFILQLLHNQLNDFVACITILCTRDFPCCKDKSKLALYFMQQRVGDGNISNIHSATCNAILT